MHGVYTAEFTMSALAAARTLMFLTAPSDAVIEIISVNVTQDNVDTNEQYDISLTRISTLGTPTATSVTPEKTEQGASAAGSTVKASVTASEPSYASVDHDHQGVSNLAGYEYFPPPESRVTVSPGGSIGVRLLAAPATAANVTVQMTFREIGG